MARRARSTVFPTLPGVWLLLCLGLHSGILRAAAPAVPRLPQNHDLFFVEDNLAYRRFLSLARDGTYRQINQQANDAAEVDRGTWEQTAEGTVALHSTYDGLRFRALRSGPLTLLLDDTAKVDALPQVAAAIARLLDRSQADVFPASDAAECNASPAVVTVDQGADSFLREALENLAAQIRRTILTETTRTYRLTPIRAPGGPLLLVLQDATFGPAQVAPVCREYRVPPGSPPPFYFAQTDAATFARRVGRWRELQPVGGWHAL